MKHLKFAFCAFLIMMGAYHAGYKHPVEKDYQMYDPVKVDPHATSLPRDFKFDRPHDTTNYKTNEVDINL